MATLLEKICIVEREFRKANMLYKSQEIKKQYFRSASLLQPFLTPPLPLFLALSGLWFFPCTKLCLQQRTAHMQASGQDTSLPRPLFLAPRASVFSAFFSSPCDMTHLFPSLKSSSRRMYESLLWDKLYSQSLFFEPV